MSSGPWLEVSGSHVFRSKLRPPSTQQLLDRAELIGQLDVCTAMPLTLVVAPAGTGKTSLVATWAEKSTSPTAWLCLDESDHDATHFWTGVLAALKELLGEELSHVFELLQRPGTVDEAVVVLLDALEAHNGPLSTLVIDNLHLIDDNTEAVTSFTVFLQHLPLWLHLVLVARRTPRLPLARMRARGELGEIGYADLRFTDDEAAELLRVYAPSLEENSIEQVVRRSDGWAAGLQLAALASRATRRSRDEQPGDRENVFVSDYVWREVFAAERAEVVQALVDISVVERVNPDLATCVSQVADAQALLAEAESRGLFVTRLGASEWFEIHTLVRERLRAELVRRSPRRAALMHERAARWFEDAGEVALALDQWILADRPRETLRLLAAKTTALYDSGREATITRTIARLPAAVASGDVEATVELAWSNLLVSREDFLQGVERASTWAEQGPALNATVQGRLTILQSIAATMQGDWSTGGDLARKALAEHGADWSADLLGCVSWNMVARDIALSERWEPSQQLSQVQHEVSRDPERRLAFEGTRALGESLAGHPVDALRIAAGVRAAAKATSMSILQLELATAEAIAHRELGDRTRAQTAFVALGALSPGPVGYATLLADLELAQMHLDDGDIAKAEGAFTRAAAMVESELGGSGAHSWLGRVGTLVALALGDVNVARRWSVTVDDSFWGPISQSRIELARESAADARRHSDEALPRCARHKVIQNLVRSQALTNRDEAVEQAAAAAELASACGLVQTVASEGARCVKLIELAAWRVPPTWLDRVRRASSASTAPLESLGLIEDLTDREREVLRLLPSRLTLREIADELYISMNTLKFHLKLIYRKLGCSSRAEAAAISQGTTRPQRWAQASAILRR
jgi:LuxR family transcriptional regulator, maltose regulon positive regulatory protein